VQCRPEYEERSAWPWWVHLLMLFVLLALLWPLMGVAVGDGGEGGSSLPGPGIVLHLLLGTGIPVLFYLFLGQLRTRVFSDAVEVSWGLAEVVRKRIPFEEIQEVRPVTYSPIKEFGGWGLRHGGRKKRAWNIRGDRAVLLTLGDGTRFYLGSDRPERATHWIQAAMAKRGGHGEKEE
jgi:hypothetical protein